MKIIINKLLKWKIGNKNSVLKIHSGFRKGYGRHPKEKDQTRLHSTIQIYIPICQDCGKHLKAYESKRSYLKEKKMADTKNATNIFKNGDYYETTPSSAFSINEISAS